MRDHSPSWKLPGLPLLKHAIAAGDARQSFVALLEILLGAGMPRSAIVHENIPGGLPGSQDVRERGGSNLSYVSDRRFIFTLTGEHRTIRDLADRGRDIVVRPGQLCWMPADSWYLVRNGSSRTMLSVVFQNNCTRFVWFHYMPLVSTVMQPVPILLSHQTASMPGAELAHALALMHAACPTTSAMEPDARIFTVSARALLAWCLQELRNDVQTGSGASHAPDAGVRLVNEISAYVTDHLQGNLSRNQVAAVFGISCDHLTRLFNAHAVSGFAEFVTAARLRFAEQLLAGSKLSIKEVGASCGFNSSAYFVKRFRERHGAPPLEWKAARAQKAK
jgi:AraC-like DNA-binding protein